MRVFLLILYFIWQTELGVKYHREDERDFAECGVSGYMYSQIYYHKAFPTFCFFNEFPTIKRESEEGKQFQFFVFENH